MCMLVCCVMTILRKARIKKKHLKSLISQHIPNVAFIQPPRRNRSEIIVLNNVVGQAVEDYVQQDVDLTVDSIIKLSRSLRKELLAFKDKWNFTGKMDDFSYTPLLRCLLEQILIGPHSRQATGVKNNDCKTTVDVLSQIILQNVKTDRQVRYKQKGDTGFRVNYKTPVSIGLPLSSHGVRDKQVVNLISDMYLGSNYKSIMNLQQRIACGVIDRM